MQIRGLSQSTRFILLAVVAVMVCRTETVVTRVASYKVHVIVKSENAASVIGTVKLVPEKIPDEFLISRYAGQNVLQIVLRQGQRAIPFTTSNSPGALIIHPLPNEHVPSADAIEIEYTVYSAGRTRRIPLPVLRVPPQPEQTAVSIQVNLPAGTVAIGNGFPALTWHGPLHGQAHLAAVPSVLVLETSSAASASWVDRLMTPAALSTTAMIALLLVGSGAWCARTYVLRGKQIGEVRS